MRGTPEQGCKQKGLQRSWSDGNLIGIQPSLRNWGRSQGKHDVQLFFFFSIWTGDHTDLVLMQSKWSKYIGLHLIQPNPKIWFDLQKLAKTSWSLMILILDPMWTQLNLLASLCSKDLLQVYSEFDNFIHFSTVLGNTGSYITLCIISLAFAFDLGLINLLIFFLRLVWKKPHSVSTIKGAAQNPSRVSQLKRYCMISMSNLNHSYIKPNLHMHLYMPMLKNKVETTFVLYMSLVGILSLAWDQNYFIRTPCFIFQNKVFVLRILSEGFIRSV